MPTLISAGPISGYNPEHGRLVHMIELVSPGHGVRAGEAESSGAQS